MWVGKSKSCKKIKRHGAPHVILEIVEKSRTGVELRDSFNQDFTEWVIVLLHHGAQLLEHIGTHNQGKKCHKGLAGPSIPIVTAQPFHIQFILQIIKALFNKK